MRTNGFFETSNEWTNEEANEYFETKSENHLVAGMKSFNQRRQMVDE